MKCLKCFNECRDDLFFCNVCGAPLLSENTGTKSAFTASEQKQSTAAHDAFSASAAKEPVKAAENKREAFVDNTIKPAYASARTETPMREPTPIPKANNEAAGEANAPKNKKGDLSCGQFVAMELLMYVPIVNIILLILWTLNKTNNPTRRNYALAKIICVPLLFVAFIIISVIMFVTGAFDSVIASLESYLI